MARCWLLALVTILALQAQTPSGDDPLLKAMADERANTMQRITFSRMVQFRSCPDCE